MYLGFVSSIWSIKVILSISGTMMLNGTPLLILLLTTSIYVTNARMFSCACPTIRTFDQAACNSDYGWYMYLRVHCSMNRFYVDK